MQLTVVGVPSSAGAHHAGLERAPAALRDAGLLTRLAEVAEVADTADRPVSAWVPDDVASTARNLDAVVSVAEDVAAVTAVAAAPGTVALVIGGDCTITLGVVAGLQRAGRRVALAYLDGDADLGAPDLPASGVLDATGVAHLVGRTDDALARLGPAFPMLEDRSLVLLGYDPDDPGSADLGYLAEHPELRHVPYADLTADPVGHARAARLALEAAGDALVVHFDVDAIDGRDLPLANFPHYGTGITVEVARLVLGELLASPRLAAVVLTEVNPTHDPNGALLARYVDLVVSSFAGSAQRREA